MHFTDYLIKVIISVFILVVMLPNVLLGQAPESISYQAVARDGAGEVLANRALTVRFTLKQTSVTGTIVYQESHAITTNTFGLFTAAIGMGTPASGTFSAIDWGREMHFLQVEVDSGSGYLDMGTSQLLSVPYAMYAKEAGNAGGGTYQAGSGIDITGNIITNTAPDQTVTLTGTGATQVSGVYPNFNISSTDSDNQTLSISGSNLSISGGNTVVLPSGGGSGTITGVTAGTGLTGGGTTGNVTLDAQNTSPLWNAGQMQGRTVAPTAPANGQVIKWNTNTQQWEPANDIGGGSGDNWGTQVVQSNASMDGDGTAGSPLGIAQQGASAGQVLKWNGTTWVPASDNNTTYTGGSGIQVSGTTITNTGDTNPNDDITIGSPAGGDLAGTYPDPTVDGLQGRPVATNAPASGQVLKWNGSAWAPATDQGKNYIPGQGIGINGDTIVNTVQLLTDLGDVNTAGVQPGQVLKWNGTGWVPAQDNTASGGAGAVSVTPRLTGDGSSGNPLDIAQQGASLGQVLKWNGSTWTPANDQGQVYTAGTGISISGGVITNTGDTNPLNDITDTTQAGGDLSGTFGNLQIVTGAVGSTEIANGSIQSVDIAPGVIPTTLPPSGAAGGDLGGTYPNPGVTKLQGNPVGTTAPGSGEVLKWDGTQWAPSSDQNTTYNAGTGLQLSGTTFQARTTEPLWNANKLQGNNVGTATPSSSQVLKWDGTQWAPAADDNTVYTAGTGIQISGTTIINTGDTNPFDDITDTTQAGGDLSGTFSNLQIVAGAVGSTEIANGSIQAVDIAPGVIPTTLPPSGAAGGDLGGTYPNPGVTKLQGNPVSTSAPASGEVLKWNGSQWAPATDVNTSYTAGTGINITANTITNSAPDQTVTINGSGATQVSGTYPTFTISSTDNDNQTLSISGNSLSISGGNAVNIPGGTITGVTAGTGLSGGGTSGNVTLNAQTTSPIWNAGQFQGRTVSGTAPTNGQVLKWNGTVWIPAVDENSTDTGHWEKSGNYVYLLNDSVGIGTSTPLAGLHVKDSVDVLFGDTMSGSSTPRLMWIADKGAFRAGRANNASWDMDSIGNQSVAFGFNTKASGLYSTAMGNNTAASGSYATSMGFLTTASGSYSTAMGYGTAASGNYSTAMGINTTTSGNYSTAMGINTTASGNYSTAMGYNTTVSGNYSTVMGFTTTASGHISTAMGYYTTASGDYSTAMGYYTTGSGDFSTVMGYFTDAKSAYETVLGRYNTAYTPNSTSTWNLSDRLFTIGNGTSSVDRSDAMVVIKNGNTGIMVSNPEAGLHVRDSVDVLFGATMSGGSGPRLMWIGDKGAFRAGRVDNASWDMDSIGNRSVAFGYNTKATGSYSTAIGYATTASGYASTAMGYITTASGDYSTAMGRSTTASGLYSTALGYNTTASGGRSTALGDNTDAKSGYEIVLGRFNTAYTPSSTSSWNLSDRLFTIGNGTSSGARSDAMVVLKNGSTGFGTSNPDQHLEVSGTGYQAIRVTSTNGNRASIEFERTGGGNDWRIMDSVGQLWIGQSSNDLVTVTEVVRLGGSSLTPASDNGATLGTPSLRWTTVFAMNGTINTSDARDKESVADLSSGLAQVMQLRPVTYRWKNHQVDNQRTHIGFLAQDLLETVPEVVVTHEWREGPEGTEREWAEAEKLGVNYSELIPVLTKAIQEQQAIIEQLQERIEALEQQ